MVNSRLDCGDCDHARDYVPLNECMNAWPYCRHRVDGQPQGVRTLESFG